MAGEKRIMYRYAHLTARRLTKGRGNVFCHKMKAEAITQEQIDEILFSEKFDRAVKKAIYSNFIGHRVEVRFVQGKDCRDHSIERGGNAKKFIASGAAGIG